MARLSTGETYGNVDRSTPQQLLGGLAVASSAGALAQQDINAPGLQPQAAPVNTYQQTGSPTLGGAVKFFAPPDLPAPQQDLANLAKSLGGFSANLQNFGEQWTASLKEKAKREEEASGALVAQTSRYGPARTIADLTANLEKKVALGGPDAIQASRDLRIVREKQNGSISRYWLERSIESNAIQTSALSLSDRLATAGAINIGNQMVELQSLPSDDPNYRAYRDQLLFEGQTISPAGFAKHQALVLQAQLQADEAQRKRYNSYQEVQIQSQITVNRRSIADHYIQYVNDNNVPGGYNYVIPELQKEIDSIRLLGLPADTQNKIINSYLQAFTGDVVSSAKAGGGSSLDTINTILRPALRSIMTGPVDQRIKKDGTKNQALRLYNTLGGEAYLDKIIAEGTASLIQDDTQKAQTAGIQAREGLDARLAAALPEGRRSNPEAINKFIESERKRAAMIPDGIQRAAVTSQINALDTQLTETYVKPVQNSKALWYAQRLSQTANNVSMRDQLAAQLQADQRAGLVSAAQAVSIQTSLSAQGSKEVRSYDKDINDRLDKMSKDWESYAKSANSYGDSVITGFENTALYKARDQARRQSHDVVYQAIKDGKDPVDALNKLWDSNNWGLRRRADAASTDNTPYTNGTDWARKNLQNWKRSTVDPTSAQRLRAEAQSKPLYSADAWATDVEALLNGNPSQNFKALLRTLTTGSGSQKPSQLILNQFKLHGVEVDEQTRQRIESLDGQKISLTTPRAPYSPLQNQALNGIQIAGQAFNNLFVPPASASEMPMPPALLGPPAILNQRRANQGVISSNARKWANAIASSGFEGADYNTKFGGGKFDNSKSHPGDGPAGRYQFQLATWKEINGGRNVPMTRANQDRAFVKLAQRRGVDVNTANPADFKTFIKLAPEWASLPTHKTKRQGFYEGQVRSTYRDFLNAWK